MPSHAPTDRLMGYVSYILYIYIMRTNHSAAPSQVRETADQTVAPFYYDLVVFCHLRWDFVYQRPQHLISRFAETLRVLFIEEPIGFAPEEEHTAVLKKVSENLHVLQPRVKDIASIAGILPDYIANTRMPMGWFYSPSFVVLEPTLDFDVTIYDCMDELSLFKGAPQELIDQEKALMAKADVVFTGGKSLYESKNRLHPNVHCFPSSVDEPHFAKALNGIAVPDDIASINGPIVGYFGVIDERIDLELIRATAASHPDISFVMIGPLAKIHESDLPRAANLHYLGMKAYGELPHYLKAFDIAMMPFALNDATTYISPTKTLEYMAAGKPIISTRIADVVRDYAGCISLIDSPDEFGQAIDYLLNDADDFSRTAEYRRILAKTSWDATAANMQSRINAYAL